MSYPKNVGYEIGQENRTRIYAWLMQNPAGKQKDCCKDLNLSPVAVNRHVAAIRDGWRPQADTETQGHA